jgi:hypothetical protein
MLKTSGLDAARLAKYRDQGLLDRAAGIMRREGVNERDAWERAVMAGVLKNATPEQVDTAYGAGAHDAVLATTAPEMASIVKDPALRDALRTTALISVFVRN